MAGDYGIKSTWMGALLNAQLLWVKATRQSYQGRHDYKQEAKGPQNTGLIRETRHSASTPPNIGTVSPMSLARHHTTPAAVPGGSRIIQGGDTER